MKRGDAIRAVRVLNDFIGHLHAARCSQVIWMRVHEDPGYKIAARYGLQIAFGVIALTMRKFEDFYDQDLAAPSRSGGCLDRALQEEGWLASVLH